jgi:4-alpha-glucanotransferase
MKGAVITLPFAATRAEATGEDGVTRRCPWKATRLTAQRRAGLLRPRAGWPGGAAGGCAAALPAACAVPAPCGASRCRSRRCGARSLALRHLRRAGRGGTALGAAGADALAINPVHALFPGHGEGYSPYSPSSRLFLNGALADPALAGLPPLRG